MKNFFIKNKFPIAIILFATFSVLVSYFYIGYTPQLGSDATEFNEAATYLSGGGEISKDALINRVITSPFFLYSSIVLNYFFNNFRVSFFFINLLFYFLTTLAFFFLALEIYKDKKIALLASTLVIFNFYIIDPGNFHLADMGGWFFFIISTYLAIKYIDTFKRRFFYWSILLATVGFFFKEYGGLGLMNLALLILVSDFPRKQKIKDVSLAFIFSVIPIFSYHFFMYLKYSISYFDKFVSVPTSATTVGYQSKSFALLIKILGWLFSFGWLAFIFGVYKELEIKDKRRLKILLACFPATLVFLIWPAITQRLAVIFMMWLALVAGFGLSKVKWYILYPFLGLYIWFNFNIKILITQINLPF